MLPKEQTVERNVLVYMVRRRQFGHAADVGYMNDYDPSDEYASMAEAGMDFRQILASLTTAPAERFGASKELGRIANGLTADLVVLNGDPSKDVRKFGAVRYTIRDGVVILRQQ